MLSNEQLLDYIRKAKQGDEKAKEIIYSINSPLIKSIIKRFKNKGVEYEDLYQIASIGFLKAVKNFDESYNVKFSTYTVPMIIGEIKRYIRDNGAIKVSRSLKIVANKINRYIDEYISQCIQPLTPKEDEKRKFVSSYTKKNTRKQNTIPVQKVLNDISEKVSAIKNVQFGVMNKDNLKVFLDKEDALDFKNSLLFFGGNNAKLVQVIIKEL